MLICKETNSELTSEKEYSKRSENTAVEQDSPSHLPTTAGTGEMRCWRKAELVPAPSQSWIKNASLLMKRWLRARAPASCGQILNLTQGALGVQTACAKADTLTESHHVEANDCGESMEPTGELNSLWQEAGGF